MPQDGGLCPEGETVEPVDAVLDVDGLLCGTDVHCIDVELLELGRGGEVRGWEGRGGEGEMARGGRGGGCRSEGLYSL